MEWINGKEENTSTWVLMQMHSFSKRLRWHHKLGQGKYFSSDGIEITGVKDHNSSRGGRGPPRMASREAHGTATLEFMAEHSTSVTASDAARSPGSLATIAFCILITSNPFCASLTVIYFQNIILFINENPIKRRQEKLVRDFALVE